jgi:hypothetical protein
MPDALERYVKKEGLHVFIGKSSLLREGMWVAMPDANGFKTVPEDARYHINSINKNF